MIDTTNDKWDLFACFLFVVSLWIHRFLDVHCASIHYNHLFILIIYPIFVLSLQVVSIFEDNK